MIVYLNDEYLPIEQARISPLDRGFLFGDGIYEVIPAYAGRLFRIDEHLDRLQDSLDGIRLPNPHNREQWIDILEGLMQRQEHDNHSIYLHVSRGADTKRDHSFPDNVRPTVFAMSTPLPTAPASLQTDGVCAITRYDIRWDRCNIKATTLLANILLRQEAVDHHCAETLMVRDGKVLEGAASNIFIVNGGAICTPPKSELLLPGITRDLVLELAQANGIGSAECELTPEQLFAADEVWVTSSTKEILPVTSIDGQSIGDGRPGPLWQKMMELYQDYKQRLISGEAD